MAIHSSRAYWAKSDRCVLPMFLLCYAPPLIGGALSNACVWRLTSVCLSVWRLSVCLSVAYIGPNSRTENPRKTKIGTEVAHVTRYSDTTFKLKGQGHHAALLSAALTRKAAAIRSAKERIRRGKVMLRCVCSAARERFGAHRGEEMRGHIVSPRAQLVISTSEFFSIVETTFSNASTWRIYSPWAFPRTESESDSKL